MSTLKPNISPPNIKKRKADPGLLNGVMPGGYSSYSPHHGQPYGQSNGSYASYNQHPSYSQHPQRNYSQSSHPPGVNGGNPHHQSNWHSHHNSSQHNGFSSSPSPPQRNVFSGDSFHPTSQGEGHQTFRQHSPKSVDRGKGVGAESNLPAGYSTSGEGTYRSHRDHSHAPATTPSGSCPGSGQSFRQGPGQGQGQGQAQGSGSRQGGPVPNQQVGRWRGGGHSNPGWGLSPGTGAQNSSTPVEYGHGGSVSGSKTPRQGHHSFQSPQTLLTPTIRTGRGNGLTPTQGDGEMISSPGKVMMCQPVVDRLDDEESMMQMEDMDDGGKDKGRGSYKCGKCGVPKKGHICPYQPKVQRHPEDPPPEMCTASTQVEMDEFLVLRRLNLEIQGFPDSYTNESPVNAVGAESKAAVLSPSQTSQSSHSVSSLRNNSQFPKSSGEGGKGKNIRRRGEEEGVNGSKSEKGDNSCSAHSQDDSKDMSNLGQILDTPITSCAAMESRDPER